MNGAHAGIKLNALLRELKQIPSPKPILGSPRVQGWLAGWAIAFTEDLEDAEAQAEKASFFVTAFDGTSMGEAFGLDMLINSNRILQAGPSVGYNAIFFEFVEKGKASFVDGKLNFDKVRSLIAIE